MIKFCEEILLYIRIYSPVLDFLKQIPGDRIDFFLLLSRDSATQFSFSSSVFFLPCLVFRRSVELNID